MILLPVQGSIIDLPRPIRQNLVFIGQPENKDIVRADAALKARVSVAVMEALTANSIGFAPPDAPSTHDS